MEASDIFYPKGCPVAIIDGSAVPIGTEQVTAAEIVERIKTIVTRLYEGTDPRKRGMTLVDAAILSAAEQAADGNLDAMEKLFNRIMGKPIQQVANLNMTTSLKEFLDDIVRTNPGATADVDPFDL